METRILVFAEKAAADAAVAKITANMDLRGSTFIYAIPAPLADGRWYVPYPGDAAWLAGVSGFTVAEGLGFAAVGEILPDRPFVPESVPNADLRIVLQGKFLPDGRSYFTAADAALAGNRNATAALADADPRRQAALAAWTQWDMGNFFHRADPLVAELGAQFGLSDAELDALFQGAAKRG